MNQFVGKTGDGKQFVEFRLEPGNLHRLKAGNPIAKRIEDMFPDGIPRQLELRISYSDTPIADARKLKEMAEVVLDERTPVTEQKRPHCPECKSTIEQLGVWRNESPMAISYCAVCGCVFGMVPSEVARGLKP